MIDRWVSSGDGYGDGYGYGSGDGSGYGDGSGSGYGITEIEGRKVYLVDGEPTIIYAIKGDVAKAATLRNNTDLIPCYVAKVGGCFAHGDTAEAALRDAEDKYAESQPVEERVAKVYAAHPDYDAAVSNEDLFRLHHVLTGSCEFGRREWCRAHGIDLGGSMTMRDFCRLTADAYGADAIARLKSEYEQKMEGRP